MHTILIVEDDLSFASMLKKFLERHGFDTHISSKASDFREAFSKNQYDLVLCDLRLPDSGGLELLSEIKSGAPNVQVVLMTGYAEVATAVAAMKKGAYDYISKPFTPDEMLMVINGALKQCGAVTHSKEETPYITPPLNDVEKSTKGQIVLESEASRQLHEYIKLVAPTDMSVLITGESGTGKEVTARNIHQSSHRSEANFVAVDCGAIPKELATSEFFGHIKGSFTGAVNDKIGHFEAANSGTLFLDEIGNLSYENQIQLLRAIQERKIKRVGSTKEIDLDVRIITATNENLQELVNEGKFREDLYHRLNEFSVQVPALRERFEDFLYFADHFLNQANIQLGKQVKGFSEDVVHAFQAYGWPGNLRELKNVIKRAVLLSSNENIEIGTLPKEVVSDKNGLSKAAVFSKTDFEKDRILKALKQTNFNKTKAARLLHITRKTLYNKIEHYELDV